VLSESYSYATYKDRVIASREFARALLGYAADHKDDIFQILAIARNARPEKVPIRSEARIAREKVTVLGYAEGPGRRATSELKPQDYVVGFEQDFVPTLTVKRPYAYLIPAKQEKAIALLKKHGIPVETLTEDKMLEVESEVIEAIDRAPQAFEGHRTVELKTESKTEKKTIPAGTAVVKTDGPLGTLAVFLLEARSEDGLATWNVFDEGLEVVSEFPVLKIHAKVDLPTR
jgi:dipeptidyl-peptidase-4